VLGDMARSSRVTAGERADAGLCLLFSRRPVRSRGAIVRTLGVKASTAACSVTLADEIELAVGVRR